MFDERALVKQLEELVPRDEVVVFAVDFVGARQARGVWPGAQWQTAQNCQESSRDTLKPNLSGNSAKRRVSSVLLPTPDGPDMTRGRRKSARGAMLAVVFLFFWRGAQTKERPKEGEGQGTPARSRID